MCLLRQGGQSLWFRYTTISSNNKATTCINNNTKTAEINFSANLQRTRWRWVSDVWKELVDKSRLHNWVESWVESDANLFLNFINSNLYHRFTRCYGNIPDDLKKYNKKIKKYCALYAVLVYWDLFETMLIPVMRCDSCCGGPSHVVLWGSLMCVDGNPVLSFWTSDSITRPTKRLIIQVNETICICSMIVSWITALVKESYPSQFRI